jgi:hypothetical protein
MTTARALRGNKDPVNAEVTIEAICELGCLADDRVPFSRGPLRARQRSTSDRGPRQRQRHERCPWAPASADRRGCRRLDSPGRSGRGRARRWPSHAPRSTSSLPRRHWRRPFSASRRAQGASSDPERRTNDHGGVGSARSSLGPPSPQSQGDGEARASDSRVKAVVALEEWELRRTCRGRLPPS